MMHFYSTLPTKWSVFGGSLLKKKKKDNTTGELLLIKIIKSNFTTRANKGVPKAKNTRIKNFMRTQLFN